VALWPFAKRAEAALNRPGRPLAWWCSASVIVRRAEDVDVLAFAIEQGSARGTARHDVPTIHDI
jgi:hypothetical protein